MCGKQTQTDGGGKCGASCGLWQALHPQGTAKAHLLAQYFRGQPIQPREFSRLSVSCAAGVSVSPTVKASAAVLVSSGVVALPITEIVGGVVSGAMPTVTSATSEVAVPSLTLKVKVSVPSAPAFGTYPNAPVAASVRVTTPRTAGVTSAKVSASPS